MLERDVDRRFTAGLKRLGLTSIKLTALGRYGTAGWPDRLVLGPGGVAVFVELKVPGNRPSPLQERQLHALSHLGFHAQWFDDPARALRYVQQTIKLEKFWSDQRA